MRAVRTLSVDLESADAPPSEFQIFAAGINSSTKGDVLFDEQAAALVMAAYAQHGQARAVPVMLDLEHLSLDQDSRSYDPDARAWFELELREGALWAVNVRWTDDGTARLLGRRQRFISPAFYTEPDPASGAERVVELINVALTALPATHQLDALIAASRVPRSEKLPRAGGCATIVQGQTARKNSAMKISQKIQKLLNSLDPDMAAKALDAVESGDSAAAFEILKALLASAAAGGEAPSEAPADEPPPAPPEGMADQPPADDRPEEMSAVVAATSRLCRLTECDTMSDALTQVETWRASHISLSAAQAKLDEERRALEQEKRLENVAALIKLGAETPATAWAGKPEKKQICARLMAEPLAEQTKRVASLSAARVGKSGSPEAPTDDAAGELSPRELAMCKRMGLKPEAYLETRVNIAKRSQARSQARA